MIQSRDSLNPITGRDPQLLKIHVAKPPTVSDNRVRRDTVVRVAHQLQLHNRPNYPIEPSTCCRICTPENSNGSPIQHDGSCSFLDPLRSPSSSPCCSCTLSSMRQSSCTNHHNQCLSQTPVNEKFFISQYSKTLLPQKIFVLSLARPSFRHIYCLCALPAIRAAQTRQPQPLHGSQNQPGDVQPICELDLHFVEGASWQMEKFSLSVGSSENMVGVACIFVKLLAHIYFRSLTALCVTFLMCSLVFHILSRTSS